MGKTVTAADMLSAGRRRPSSPTPETDLATKRLDAKAPGGPVAQVTERSDDSTTALLSDQTTERLEDQTPERLGHQAPSRLDAATPRSLGAQASARLDDSTVRSLDAAATRRADDQSPSPTYQRATVFFTPQQRQWMKQVSRDLPDGLSMSDVVRLAVSRLQDDVTRGLNLVPALAEQAHADAEVFTGRRNRGLPSQHEQTA